MTSPAATFDGTAIVSEDDVDVVAVEVDEKIGDASAVDP
jgi:hypothetical protein